MNLPRKYSLTQNFLLSPKVFLSNHREIQGDHDKGSGLPLNFRKGKRGRDLSSLIYLPFSPPRCPCCFSVTFTSIADEDQEKHFAFFHWVTQVSCIPTHERKCTFSENRACWSGLPLPTSDSSSNSREAEGFSRTKSDRRARHLLFGLSLSLPPPRLSSFLCLCQGCPHCEGSPHPTHLFSLDLRHDAHCCSWNFSFLCLFLASPFFKIISFIPFLKIYLCVFLHWLENLYLCSAYCFLLTFFQSVCLFFRFA